MAGLWLKLDARLPDNGVWRDLLDARAWLWILCRAKRPPPGVPVGTVRVTSATLARQLAGTLCGRRFEPGPRALRTTLRRLVADGRVVVAEWASGAENARRLSGAQGFLTVTVCNFGAYQGGAEGVGRGSNGHATARNGSTTDHATLTGAEGVGRPTAEGSAEGVGRGVGRGSDDPRTASNGLRASARDVSAAEGSAEGRGRRSADQEEIRREEEKRAAGAAHSAAAFGPQDLMALWNDVASRHGWVPARGLSPRRRTAALARLREQPTREAWQVALERAGRSPFLLGRTTRAPGHEGWRPDFDWLTKPDTVLKLSEGKYDGAPLPTPAPRDPLGLEIA